MSEYNTRDMKLRLSFLGSSYTWARGSRLYPVDIVKCQVKFCLLLDFLRIILFLTNLASTGGPHEISRRAACGPRTAGWTALPYAINLFCHSRSMITSIVGTDDHRLFQESNLTVQQLRRTPSRSRSNY